MAWRVRTNRGYAFAMTPDPFTVPFGQRLLHGDAYELPCRGLVLHGAGDSRRDRFSRLRRDLCDRGLPTAAFDCIGHGETGGELLGSCLRERTEQAAGVIAAACREPLTLIGASMGAYTALRLTEGFAVEGLVLIVPAAYAPATYEVPFGPAFSAVIRESGSWRDSDAFALLRRFTGRLLIVAGENDSVIPSELVERLHAAATAASVNRLYVVPGGQHIGLLDDEAEYRRVLDLIASLADDMACAP